MCTARPRISRATRRASCRRSRWTASRSPRAWRSSTISTRVYPDPPMVPRDPLARARVLAQALVIAADIHPVDNLRILKRLESRFGADQAAKDDWYRHWIMEGFTALETLAGGECRPVPGRRRAQSRRCVPGAADVQCAALRDACWRRFRGWWRRMRPMRSPRSPPRSRQGRARRLILTKIEQIRNTSPATTRDQPTQRGAMTATTCIAADARSRS